MSKLPDLLACRAQEVAVGSQGADLDHLVLVTFDQRAEVTGQLRDCLQPTARIVQCSHPNAVGLGALGPGVEGLACEQLAQVWLDRVVVGQSQQQRLGLSTVVVDGLRFLDCE